MPAPSARGAIPPFFVMEVRTAPRLALLRQRCVLTAC
jgi:hypothetical protein